MSTAITTSKQDTLSAPARGSKNPLIKSYYLRDEVNRFRLENGQMSRGNPRALIVSLVDYDTQTISFGFAIRHPRDKFDKKRAREMALGRLAHKPFVIPLPKNATGLTINLAIMTSLVVPVGYVGDRETNGQAVARRFTKQLWERAGLDKEVTGDEMTQKSNIYQWVHGLLTCNDGRPSRLCRLASDWLVRAAAYRKPRQEQAPSMEDVARAINTLKSAGYEVSGLAMAVVSKVMPAMSSLAGSI